MEPGCLLKPTERWLVSSYRHELRKAKWRLHWASLFLGQKGLRSGKSGPGLVWPLQLTGYRNPITSCPACSQEALLLQVSELA